MMVLCPAKDGRSLPRIDLSDVGIVGLFLGLSKCALSIPMHELSGHRVFRHELVSNVLMILYLLNRGQPGLGLKTLLNLSCGKIIFSLEYLSRSSGSQNSRLHFSVLERLSQLTTLNLS